MNISIKAAAAVVAPMQVTSTTTSSPRVNVSDDIDDLAENHPTRRDDDFLVENDTTMVTAGNKSHATTRTNTNDDHDAIVATPRTNVSNTPSTNHPPPQQQQQVLLQEHDQRLIQVLQYIATMNTTTTAATKSTLLDDDVSATTKKRAASSNTTTTSTTTCSKSKKGTAAAAATNEPTTSATTNSTTFVQTVPWPITPLSSSPTTQIQRRLPVLPPPYFFFHETATKDDSDADPTEIEEEDNTEPDKIVSNHQSRHSGADTETIRNTHSSFAFNRQVIFTTDTFRYCYAACCHSGKSSKSLSSAAAKLPFSFYASSSSHGHGSSNNNKNESKIASSGTLSKQQIMGQSSSSKSDSGSSSSCWLRLTRLSGSSPPTPAISTTASKNGTMKQVLEPIYNRLFDYIQQQDEENQQYELLWGLGHAYYCSTVPPSSPASRTIINGPLLEVPMEIELGKKDGAIYLRPKQMQHSSGSGVRVNRDVLTALLRNSTSSSSTATDTLLQSWYRKIQNDIDVAQISPAQPESYRPILQQMAVELVSNGIFIESATLPSSWTMKKISKNIDANQSCIFTDAWCLYKSNKPTSVLSRDALAFVDRISGHNTMKDIQPSTTSVQQQQLSPATWAITHGPGSYERYRKKVQEEMESKHGNDFIHWIRSTIFRKSSRIPTPLLATPTMNLPPKISLPLPSTEAQHRIVDMLLYQNYPCVVVEGPPGTGKSQTICNMICAYLRVGKRILVTSKHSSSLSVIRKRLPKTIQELCIDVSNSEYNGVRQLQQTVERLSNRLANSTQQQQVSDRSFGGGGMQQQSSSSTVIAGPIVDTETEKLLRIQKEIDDHENELKRIDDTITSHNKRMCQLLQSPDGKQYMHIAIELLEKMPWLMTTIAKWTPYEVMKLRDRIEVFVLKQRNDPIERVCNYSNPPSNAIISLAASYANMKLHVASNVTKKAVASIPLLGSWIGMDQHTTAVEKMLSNVRIGEQKPTTPDDWLIVVRGLRRAHAIHLFGQGEWKTYEHNDSWPSAIEFFSNHNNVRDLYTNLCKSVEMKQLGWKLNIGDMIATSIHCQSLDTQRCVLSKQIHKLSEELVNLTVVTELCRSLSEEALSALIRFSQIAGKAKFHKPNIPVAKMSQRQRRHRDDYLDAFDRCCRYIPCWILTTSQISDFLPPEPLFDLVIIDETSQSDITVLPTMLRGKQWLVVGDGKQVSPTETFISEEQMEHLRAIIPQCYFESSLLPGQSFFDLCAQAFPTSRVVLNEHFRCASEIIAFSNEHFYDNQLIPLRLPTQSERITPSIVDVRLPKGIKVGKINEKEVDEIVQRVAAIVELHDHGYQPQQRRSIGIISLMGDEQSRTIRGRLLDTIGPLLMAQHSILVGDPPSFQGTERDIIFLSMVCSPSRSPTQSQLVHFQRANVALSRARDQCILVRSIDISDVPSTDDVKIPIIEFFLNSVATSEIINNTTVPSEIMSPVTSSAYEKNVLRNLLVNRLREKGYKLCGMGVVWHGGICIEHPECDERMALIIGDTSFQDWYSSYRQQQKLESVGWKCVRVNVLSFLSDCDGTMQSIFENLQNVVGIQNSDSHVQIQSSSSISTDFPARDKVTHDAIASDAVPSSSLVDLSADISHSHTQEERSDRVNKRRGSAGKDTEDDSNAKTAAKRPRKNRTRAAITLKQKQHDVIDAEMELSLDSQSNGNNDDDDDHNNVVVDLSFLRDGKF